MMKWVRTIFLFTAGLGIIANFAFAGDAWVEQSIGYASGRYTAKKNNQPMMVYFYTDWCGYCQRFESRTLADPAVKMAIESFIKIRINPEHGSAEENLAQRYGVRGYPSVYFLMPKDDPGAAQRVGSLHSSTEFISDTKKFLKKKRVSYKAAKIEEAILPVPVKKIKKTHRLYLNDGSIYAGRLIEEDEKSVKLETADFEEKKFLRSEISRIETLSPK